jgi:hypothetical protein
MGHSTGDNSQAIIEHNFVVHYHEFYFDFLVAVNKTLLLPCVQSFSPHGIIDYIAKLGNGEL